VRVVRLTTAGSVLLLCAALAAGCGGKKAGDTTTSAPPTTTTTVLTAPLTGMPEPDEAVRNRPLLTVKVDNHPEARPQFGIDKADDIVEERVEGGLTRFMALFQSKESDRVGPVRSLRSSDPKWLEAEGGMIAYSGGIDPVKSLLGPAGITDLGADNHGATYYKRRSDRPYEHSMYTITPVLRTLTPKNATAPKPLYQYVKPGEHFTASAAGGAAPVASVTVHMGGGPTGTVFDWTWNASNGLFMRSTDGKPHEFEGAGQIGMRNVIVQFVSYRQTPWRDRANSPVDEAVVTGSGDAWILSEGQIVKGHWSRPGGKDITTFTDAAGAPVKLLPGQTWLTLAPVGEAAEAR
jgi:hypothetical protein